MVIGVIIVIVSAILVAKLCATLLFDERKRNDIIDGISEVADATKKKTKRVMKKVKDKIDET